VSDLVEVADGAYPQTDYSFLPATVTAWWGYLGGHTPHIWTTAEIAHLEATGRPFWSVWTAPEGVAYTPAQATTDAHGMVAALQARNRAALLPVALDVEESTYDANPVMARDNARLWCAIMRSSGYPNAVWYSKCHSEATWQACWGAGKPVSLPPGVIGVQYDHALANDRYDISVFDVSLLEDGTMLTADDIAAAIWQYATKNSVDVPVTSPAVQRFANGMQKLWEIADTLAAVQTAQQTTNDLLTQLLAKP